jgi:hypothetical protein
MLVTDISARNGLLRGVAPPVNSVGSYLAGFAESTAITASPAVARLPIELLARALAPTLATLGLSQLLGML